MSSTHLTRPLTPMAANAVVNNSGVLLPDRPIAFNRDFVKIGCGINGALMLSQAVYWDKRTKDSNGWFYKTQEEWEGETGLTKEEQKTTNKRLVSLGYLAIKKAGMPAKNYYRVEREAVIEALIMLQWGQKPPTSGGKSHPHSISEITTEKFSDENPPLKVEMEEAEPQTFESYMHARGYTEDSIVDDVGGTHHFWVGDDGKKLSKTAVTSLRSSFNKTRVLGAVLPQIEDATDRFVTVYKQAINKRFGQTPEVGWETKKILKKNLLDKYPKEFVKDYAQWFVDNEGIDRKWKFDLRAFTSERFINQFKSSQ